MIRSLIPGAALLTVTVMASFASADTPITLGLAKDRPVSGRFVETDQGFMLPYKTTIPGTAIEFEMEPIPGGKFLFGSPVSELNRRPDEGPQVEIEVQPYWIGKYEVTWAEYKAYMRLLDPFKKFDLIGVRKISPENEHLAVTIPSKLYDPESTFGSGDDPRQPALSMSQFAAKQYTKWLSGISGEIYRLPTEAEWEFACRAGTTSAFNFGNDSQLLVEHGWFRENADEKTHKVGEKKPNGWNLFDMHGNVAEWVIDSYSADGFRRLDGKTTTVTNAVTWSSQRFPRVVRGGAWDDEAANCRSAARCPSHDDDWRAKDPNVPQSPWWFTEGHGLAVGFRIVRPLTRPTRDETNRFWEADAPDITDDVNIRIDEEGKGARGIADRELPKAVLDLKKRLPEK